MKLRPVWRGLACGVAVVVALTSAASAAGGPRAPRLLINTGEGFGVRPAMVVVGMVAITEAGVSSADYQAGRYGHIRWVRWSNNEALAHGRAWVPDGPGGGVRPHPATVRASLVSDGRYTRLEWTYRSGSRTYTEQDKLMRFGRDYGWRVVGYAGNP